MMNKRLIKPALLAVCLLLCCGSALAENIDPDEDGSQYAYSANIGWLNFEPSEGPGVTVTTNRLIGYVWSANIGWISLSCRNTDSCDTVNYEVTNDGAGALSGYAWSANAGWINFNPTGGGVTIDSGGNFDGWAYGANIGWIHLRSAGPVAYGVQACVVTLVDLQIFASYWLSSGSGPADLDGEADTVDFEDYVIFSGYWQDFCPDGWQLK